MGWFSSSPAPEDTEPEPVHLASEEFIAAIVEIAELYERRENAARETVRTRSDELSRKTSFNYRELEDQYIGEIRAEMLSAIQNQALASEMRDRIRWYKFRGGRPQYMGPPPPKPEKPQEGELMPNYRSKVLGGFFQNPETSHAHVSIRANNPGAVNGSAWERAWPGYVNEIKYDGKNNTTIFETPEDGIAVWYELMRKYRASGQTTIKEIVWKYGGGQANYDAYGKEVARWMGVSENTKIVLEDDKSLLPFAKAMFRYEAGVNPIPWTDEQIVYGFNLARHAGTAAVPPPAPKPVPKPPVVVPPAAKTVGVGAVIAAAAHAAGAHWGVTLALLVATAGIGAFVYFRR